MTKLLYDSLTCRLFVSYNKSMSSLKEILAPAGDLQTLKVAVDSGADAVYVGASKFNARYGAKNFSFEELMEGVKYAHLFGVKVYLTLNTIIKNNEFSEVEEVVDQAISCGVDAFLVQDMGLALFLKTNYKNIVLHASTQLACHNKEGARVLEKFGFSRVVLSREATIQDILDIKHSTNLEIEYFVQGAQCVGFSGNCYFSSICTACSGNRGKCKQFCRLEYEAHSKNKMLSIGFLLSPSDQCLVARLQELVNAGVDSFKIEGRLKKPSYVACSIKLFKTALNGEDTTKLEQSLKQIFARGDYNKGQYLDGKNDGIINPLQNNHTGIQIGQVKKVQRFKNIYQIEISSSHQIKSGDALKFYVNGKETASAGVGNVEMRNGHYIVYSKHQPKTNAFVNLIVDSELEKSILPKPKKLPCNINFVAHAGRNAELEMCYGNTCIKIFSKENIEQAKTTPTTSQDIENNLAKLNDTFFELSNCNVVAENVFIAKSVINQMRRDAVSKLTDVLFENSKPKVEKSKQKLINQTINCTNSYVVVDNVLNISSDNKCYIFAPKEYTIDNLQSAVAVAKEKGVKLFLDLPNVARHADMLLLKNLLSNFVNSDFGIVANNIYAFEWADKFEVIAGLGLNIVNDYAKICYLQLGATDVIYSVEANIKDIAKDGVIYAFGYPVLMTLTHCPVKMMFKNNCANCKYFEDIIYQGGDGRKLNLKRKKLAHCYFELVDSVCIDNRNCSPFRTFVDKRNVFAKENKKSNGLLYSKI